MRDHDDVYSLTGERYNIGLSSVFGLTLVAYQIATTWKYLSGGSLEIVTSSTASPWGLGYLVGTGEVFNANMTGTFYLAATGATVTICLTRGKSNGS